MLWLLSWMNCIMPEFPRSDFRLHIGWRNIKTSVTAMLVAMAYCLIGRNPAFTDKSICSIQKYCITPGTFSGPRRLQKGSGFLLFRCFLVQAATAFFQPPYSACVRLFSIRTVHVTIDALDKQHREWTEEKDFGFLWNHRPGL